jgi:hypothetical protein
VPASVEGLRGIAGLWSIKIGVDCPVGSVKGPKPGRRSAEAVGKASTAGGRLV